MEDLLMLGGFILLWLLLSSLTKAPNYTRLLVTLPFVAYLVIQGIKFVGAELRETARKVYHFDVKHLAVILFSAVVIIIASWNISIFGEYVDIGVEKGDIVGGTARYVESKSSIEGYSFYIATASSTPYYSWGEQEQWKMWVGLFTGSGQSVEVLGPETYVDRIDGPSTVFLSDSLWNQSRDLFIIKYPEYKEHYITPDGKRLAIEIE